MIRRFSCIVLFASLALPSAAAGRRVLLAVVNEPKAIEVVVLLDPIEPPNDSFAFDQEYVLSADGRRTGIARAFERVQLGCVSNAARAELVGDGVFATNFEPHGVPVRDATDGEMRMLRRWARQLFINRGFTDLENLSADVAVVDQLFVGSFVTNSSALFFIARTADVTPARVIPQFTHVSPRDPDGDQGREFLVGALDLDGDEASELITRRSHKEGYDYIVYRRVRGRWTAIQGGGSGC